MTWKDLHIFYFLNRGINIVSWIAMTRKSAEHPLVEIIVYTGDET